MGSLFEALFNFLVDLLVWICNVFLNLFIDFINFTIQAIADAYSYIIGLLPDSCFVQLSLPSELLSHIHMVNWFIPLHAIVQCVTTFCCGMLGYMAIKPVLKFLHVT